MDEPDDPDKEYSNDDNKEEEKKKENNKKKNNFTNNADKTDKTPKKKKKKKKKNPANPPKSKQSDSLEVKPKINNPPKKKENLISNNNNDNNPSSERDINTNQNIDNNIEKMINFNDYLFDIMDYSKAFKEDRRGFFFTFISLIKNNSTLLFVISCDTNDLFTRVSVLILTLSFYIFINILFMFNTSILHLYIGKDDFDKYESKNVIMNLLIPFILLYIPIMLLKKITSIREFFYEQNYRFSKVVNDYESNRIKHSYMYDKVVNDDERKRIVKAQTQLRLHDIETQISKFKNYMDYWEKFVFWGGFIFLLFNFYLTTCFCGIYQNSFGCLISNTVMSMVFTFGISFIFFLISTILRIYGLSDGENITSFYISSLLNPTFILYGKIMIKRYKDDNYIE